MELHDYVEVEFAASQGLAPVADVRAEIAASWRECVASGLRHDYWQPPHEAVVDVDSPLAQAGGPVVDRLGRDLHGTGVAVVLADDRACVVGTHAADELMHHRLVRLNLAPGFAWQVETAGTNALGLATRDGSWAIVDGREHFMDALIALTTAAVPVCDRRSGELCGTLALVSASGSANTTLLLAVARHAAREIEQRLADGWSARQRLLNDAFQRDQRRARGPLVVVDDRCLLMNAAAATALSDADRAPLWEMASRALKAGDRSPLTYVARSGTPMLGRLEPIYDGDTVVAALVHFRSPARPAPRPARPTFGWASLTDAELSLVELVASGLTNREAAGELYLSPHTVDSHLRHIFRKLDIRSRVELARLAAEKQASAPVPACRP
jgi:transcriptional regulator of acetoin/glycerol metabolism/DNA-binding CsgD family transcriptional regulator